MRGGWGGVVRAVCPLSVVYEEGNETISGGTVSQIARWSPSDVFGWVRGGMCGWVWVLLQNGR